MQYLTLEEVIVLHRMIIDQSGGGAGIRDLGMLESALAQPQMTFGPGELYSTIEEKAAAICYSLVMNHPFVDGNKRIGHAVAEVFLVLNGYELESDVDTSEEIILQLASGELSRDDLLKWIREHISPKSL